MMPSTPMSISRSISARSLIVQTWTTRPMLWAALSMPGETTVSWSFQVVGGTWNAWPMGRTMVRSPRVNA